MKRFLLLFPLSFSLLLLCCKSKQDETGTETEIKSRTPVTVTHATIKTTADISVLNATSVYQRKNTVRSTLNGYIEKVFVQPGDIVNEGQNLFIIRTKEADALKNFESKDSAFTFKGSVVIKAPSSGIVTDIVMHANDYVSDGDALASVADRSSFVFVVNVPYELISFAKTGTKADIVLPDSSIVPSTVVSRLSVVDPATQTISIIAKPDNSQILPENLIVSVRLLKNVKKNALMINRGAVLSDETLQNFWVMLVVNDSTAVKTPVITGIATKNEIEIVSPTIDTTQKIILNGAFGLPDTAFILLAQ